MQRNQRIGLLAAALVIVVVGFVALRPSGGDKPSSTGTTTARQPASGAGSSGTTPSQAQSPQPKPQPPLLHAGVVRKLTVAKGDVVRFRVRAGAPEEVHVHGYDIKKELQPGKTATVAFKADIEGVFEIELEHSATPLATLTVKPR
jgi:hypothetical protein